MSKYEKFSKEELLALVEKQDNELASKKYGLVWDSEREPRRVNSRRRYKLWQEL